MKTHLENFSTTSEQDVATPGNDVDLVAIQALNAHSRGSERSLDVVSSTTDTKDGVTSAETLEELLDREPQEAVESMFRSLEQIYQERTHEHSADGASVKSFATRDKNNTRLDDYYDIMTFENGDVRMSATCMPHKDTGYRVVWDRGEVYTYTITGSYVIPAGRAPRPDHDLSSTHDRILKNFVDRAGKTAELVLDRNADDMENGTNDGINAHQQAKAMLMAEKFPDVVA